jgi:DNA-directed RNA polymerase subunit omega
MARITVEDCLKKVNNRFTLIHMASQRVRQLRKGAEPTISSKNRDVVIALREIAAGTIKKAEITNKAMLMEDQEDTSPDKTAKTGTKNNEATSNGQDDEEAVIAGDE